MHFEEVIQKLNSEATDKRDKGTKFEQIIQRWFENDDLYFIKDQLENVFLWKDFPFKGEFGTGQDIGIDLVIKEKNGKYHSVQCKCYDDDTKVTKEDVAKFIASSNRVFHDKNKKECTFDNRFFITSNNNLTENALKEIQQQKTNKPILVTKSHLEKSNIDWLELYNQVILNAPRCNLNRTQKQLRDHQQKALNKTHNHFLNNDRGKLIMACGTGKTFTALKIAENETNCQGLILFLVPSIALLGQTLYEWKYESAKPFKAICVCSDSKISTKNKKDEDDNVESVEDLAYPATTDPDDISYQIAEGRKMGVMTVIFSTYQSIDVVIEVFSKHNPSKEEIDLIIADEAHRTTGYFESAKDQKVFTKVHYDYNIKAKKRLYMTATPRIYSAKVKAKIKEKNAQNNIINSLTAESNNNSQPKEEVKNRDESVVCSMDDPEIYGEEIYRLSFSEAVDKELLTDYKVLILTTSKELGKLDLKYEENFEIPKNVDLEDKARIWGSVSALSKLMTDDDKIITDFDPKKMKRAVAFCGTIAFSRYATATYNAIREYLLEERAKNLENSRSCGCDSEELSSLTGCNTLTLTVSSDNSEAKILKEDSLSLEKKINVATTEKTEAVPCIAPAKASVEVSASTTADQNANTKETLTEEAETLKKILPISCHIDGSMSALERDRLLQNLKREPKKGFCNILTNAKCLSEGVDVPSLDAVIFLSPKRSKADIIQSVGRVMRKAEGKDCGYIIIPVLCDGYKTANEAIDKSEEFAVVWEVLNALRSHDDRMDIEVNTIKAGGKPTHVFVVGDKTNTYKTNSSISDVTATNTVIQTVLNLGDIQKEFYAKFVEKVGTKNYIENWAKEVAELAVKEYDRINDLITKNLDTQHTFDEFLQALRQNVNPNITREQAIEMLTQQLITKPIFEALFGDENVTETNGISEGLQKILNKLEGDRSDKVYKKLAEFYYYVKKRVSHLQSSSLSYSQKKAERQEIIKELYGKFFKNAFPRVQEQLGIVYTPNEAVDFMINSVDDVLKEEFGKSLADEGINILDPFTGTGTFITRLLEYIGKKDKNLLKNKFLHELHANEIVLLAYYIAGVNIEMTYRDLTGEHLPFKKLCLQDTFLSYEEKIKRDEEIKQANELFGENAENAIAQQESEITVIIGNPPYSFGQKSANDNAKNQRYEKLEEKIKKTYIENAGKFIPTSLYDSYIKAFRYATDRIKDKGIICFITNGGWLDSASGNGFRKCLEKDFDKIYILNLRGNKRTKGEISKKEGEPFFESGCITTICITLLVKNGKNEGCQIKYCDIGDYLSRKEKIAKIAEAKSFFYLNLIEITSDTNGNWINKRNNSFDNFIPIYPEKKFEQQSKSFFITYSCGYKTNQDGLFYNFSKERLDKNYSKALDFYNSERERYHNSDKSISLEDFVNKDNDKLSFNLTVLDRIKQNIKIKFDDSENKIAFYRPFCIQNFRDEKRLIRTISYMPKLFPNGNFKNLVISITGIATPHDFSCIITDKPVEFKTSYNGQNFPLYWYEKVEKSNQGELDLFAENSSPLDQYIRRDGISDWILKRAKELYSSQISNKSGNLEPLSLRGSLRPWQSNGFVNIGKLNNQVTKEDIFYYVYGFLHLESYRKKFANNLKNELPKIPLVEDYATFEKISKAGRDLAELHLNFEPEPNVENVTEADYVNNYIKKVEESKDKRELLFFDRANNVFERLPIPFEVDKWQINGSTATWWIADRYKVTVDKKTGRINDPNDYAREYGNPRYIIELAKNVINIAIKTVAILDELNKLQVEI